MKYWIKAFKKNAWRVEWDEIVFFIAIIGIVLFCVGIVTHNYLYLTPFFLIVTIFILGMIYYTFLKPLVQFFKRCRTDKEIFKEEDNKINFKK